VARGRGPLFVLTHHPEDAAPVEAVTFLNCDVAEAVRIGLDAATARTLRSTRRPPVDSSLNEA